MATDKEFVNYMKNHVRTKMMLYIICNLCDPLWGVTVETVEKGDEELGKHYQLVHRKTKI